MVSIGYREGWCWPVSVAYDTTKPVRTGACRQLGIPAFWDDVIVSCALPMPAILSGESVQHQLASCCAEQMEIGNRLIEEQ